MAKEIAESWLAASGYFAPAKHSAIPLPMVSLISDFAAFPLLLIDLAIAAISLSAEAFARVASTAEGQTAALAIAFLAGVSELLGQSVILVVNRVALYRFLASLAFTGVTYLATALTWAASAYVIAPLTLADNFEAGDAAGVLGVVSLAFAPRLLGVFAIAPYFGLALSNLLEVWAMALVIFGFHTGLDMPISAALVCGGAGWLLSYGLRSFFGHVLARPIGKLRTFVNGSPLDKSPKQLIDDLVDHLKPEDRR